MDFPSHPKGWVPLTMEDKRNKEQERMNKKVPYSIMYSNYKTRREQEWEHVYDTLETYHKGKSTVFSQSELDYKK
jgi:hypothetical protein